MLAACGLPLALGGSVAPAQTAPASDAPAPVPAVGAPMTLYPGTKEYVWTLYVPVLTTERIAVVVRVPKEHVIGRRWDYEYPGLKSQRFKLGEVAEFNCKYSDWGLPQECRTEWHSVYADLPVLAMQRDHLDYDESEWAWEEQTMRIDVPHWSWKASTLTVSVPIFGPKNTEQAQAALDAQQAAAMKRDRRRHRRSGPRISPQSKPRAPIRAGSPTAAAALTCRRCVRRCATRGRANSSASPPSAARCTSSPGRQRPTRHRRRSLALRAEARAKQRFRR